MDIRIKLLRILIMFILFLIYYAVYLFIGFELVMLIIGAVIMENIIASNIFLEIKIEEINNNSPN